MDEFSDLFKPIQAASDETSPIDTITDPAMYEIWNAYIKAAIESGDEPACRISTSGDFPL